MSRYVKWDLTSKCNLRCIHCMVGKNYFPDDVKDISLDEKLRIIDNLACAGIGGITFLGGEPLVTKDIFPVAKAAASKGIAITVVTNGTLLNEARIAQILDARVSCVTVSIDGASAATDDQIRGEGSFAKTVTNVRNLVSRVSAAKCNTIVKVNAVVNKVNRGEIDSMFELCKELGVDEISFLTLTDSGRATDHRNELALTPAETIEAAIAIGQKAATINKEEYPTIKQQLAPPLVCDYIRQKFGIEMPGSEASTICCFGAISLGYITPDGFLFPCSRIVSDNYIGRSIRGARVERKSLLRHSFDEIWSSDYFVKMFDLVMDDKTYSEYSPCSKCKYLTTRQCNPCPLDATHADVSFDTCLIAHKFFGDEAAGKRKSDDVEKTDSLFYGFNQCRHSGESLAWDLYAQYEREVPAKAVGIRSFDRNGVTMIFNPRSAEYCRLGELGKFVWDLADGIKSIKEISSEVEDVVSEVGKRLGWEGTGSELHDTIKCRVAAYCQDLGDSGFVKMGQQT